MAVVKSKTVYVYITIALEDEQLWPALIYMLTEHHSSLRWHPPGSVTFKELEKGLNFKAPESSDLRAVSFVDRFDNVWGSPNGSSLTSLTLTMRSFAKNFDISLNRYGAYYSCSTYVHHMEYLRAQKEMGEALEYLIETSLQL